MDIKEVNAIVNHTDTKKYRVSMINGKSRIVRLWLHSDGCVCIIGKGRKHYGHHLSPYSWDDLEEWATLKLVEHKEKDYYKLFVKRAKDGLKMLTESGLWPDIKKDIETFFELSENEQRELVNDIKTDCYEKFYKQTYGDGKYSWVGCYQVFESFASNVCWKSIAYSKWNRKHYNEQVENAIKNKENYHRRWTNGYDNTLEITFEKGTPRAWYSEEYRGCANGWYYLMFDATHAIFYEKD